MAAYRQFMLRFLTQSMSEQSVVYKKLTEDIQLYNYVVYIVLEYSIVITVVNYNN